MLTHAAFDPVAASYDDDFTQTPIARLMRRAVWSRLDANFCAGMRVLELGCGTGEDATYLARRGIHVTATDASAQMLALTRQKAALAGVSEFVETQVLDMNSIDGGQETGDGVKSSSVFRPPSYDSIFSNFGALNCVTDIKALAKFLSGQTKPGARVVLVVMGPFCLWEIIWHLLHAQPRRAFRRWARDGAWAHVGSGSICVRYPSPQQLIKLFAPSFAHRRTSGLGVFLPPPYVRMNSDQPSVNSSRSIVGTVHWSLFTADWLERRVARLWPFNQCGDHYILELERI